MTDMDTDRVVAEARARAVADGWDPTWIRTAADARATLRGCYFNLAAAERVRRFLELFVKHAKGRWAGQPVTLEDWQWTEVIAPLYGWCRPDGSRRLRKGYFSCGKKNGKTLLFGVALPLFHLLADGEPGPRVALVAADRWQSSQGFDDISAVVRSSPPLAGELEVIDSRKLIVFARQNGRLEAFSADVPSKEGLSLSYQNVDELHATPDRAMFDTLRYAGAARRQPLAMTTTTAGVVDEAGICWEQVQYARGVADGSIDDDGFFVYIAEAPAGLAIDDPVAWRAANPNLGVTLDEAELRQECAAALASPSQQSAFRRYRLNEWQSQSQSFVSMATWDACHVHPVNEPDYAGQRAYLGLDLAATKDMNALAEVFPCQHGDPEAVDLFCRTWLPQGALEGSRNRHLYEQWADDGHLILTPGGVSDYGFIRRTILADAARWPVDSIGVDRLFQGLELATALGDEGFAVFPVGMGYMSLGPLMKEFERLILSGRLHHGGHPVLRWCVGNVQVLTDAAGNIKPSRETPTQKIDLVIAVLLALDRYLRREQEGRKEESVYENQGITFLNF